jgi:hypothetical protein
VSAEPLIVSALLGAEDFAWFDGLRRAHYPPARNQLAAHLTMFHHLPPSLAAELKQRLKEAVKGRRPRAEAAGLLDLGQGVAVRIVSPELEAIRADLADAFGSLLMPQDKAGWRPHVTIQNKVAPTEARRLRALLSGNFAPRAVTVEGLAVWRYRGGPWEPLSRHIFERS